MAHTCGVITQQRRPMAESHSPRRSSLAFLGATGTVTGSRYLLSSGDSRVLIDCGLFQGYKQLRLRNWARLPFDPAKLDAVLLTHAHIDHSGYLPVLARDGFRGKIFASAATFEVCRILLPDSAFLQEEEARFANRHGLSRHKPALPLYTQEDAKRCLDLFSTVKANATVEAASGMAARFAHAGHMLGARTIHVSLANTSILFSGDLGRSNDPLMPAPSPPLQADYVVTESTYGDRAHPFEDVSGALAAHINRAMARGGVIVAPTFAVGRAQLMMLLLARLKAARSIPDIPVFLDSPMAIDATRLYTQFAAEHRLSREECEAMAHVAQLVHTAEESKALDRRGGPMLILSASGMATGGRVVHHLKYFAPDERNLILLPGFQAGGTRGASLAAGAERIRISTLR